MCTVLLHMQIVLARHACQPGFDHNVRVHFFHRLQLSDEVGPADQVLLTGLRQFPPSRMVHPGGCQSYTLRHDPELEPQHGRMPLQHPVHSGICRIKQE